MTPFSYPARIEPADDNEFLVTFADLPEALTSDVTYEGARLLAEDALAVALEGYLLANREPPPCRLARADELDVAVPPALAARLLLASQMRLQGLTKVALADRIGRDEKAVRRMLAGQGSSMEQTLGALAVLGVRPVLAAA